MTTNLAWQERYREALLELKPDELPGRIAAAEKAIYQRIEELGRTANSSSEEQEAIGDALRRLRLLAETECQGSPPPDAGVAETEASS